MGDKLPVTVTVILPTRNEEEAIEPTIDSIPTGWCKKLEILIVDGNSSDKTRELALRRGPEFILRTVEDMDALIGLDLTLQVMILL